MAKIERVSQPRVELAVSCSPLNTGETNGRCSSSCKRLRTVVGGQSAGLHCARFRVLLVFNHKSEFLQHEIAQSLQSKLKNFKSISTKV
jgi:hypothetical protein